MSRKNQTNKLKCRVMEVALGHFSEVGIERTNVSNILTDAGCSVGSLYHHFGNKEGIAEALFIDGVDQFNSRLLSDFSSAFVYMLLAHLISPNVSTMLYASQLKSRLSIPFVSAVV